MKQMIWTKKPGRRLALINALVHVIQSDRYAATELVIYPSEQLSSLIREVISRLQHEISQ